MSKKLLTAIIVTIVICSAVFFQQVSSDTINHPTNIKLTITPPSVPSDNSTTNCIFVQLQDSDGTPARATKDTTISLSSSITEIGTVDPTLTIKTGDTYASANFSSTFTPGETVITAAATGYETVQAPITTVGPKPYTVAVYGFPSVLPADSQTYQAIMVQLQDSSGSPAKAPNGGTEVTLSCSKINVGNVTSTVTIQEGQTYALANFTTGGTTGEAVITPIASDYTSKPVTITTENVSTSDELIISTGSPKVLADNVPYPQIAVQLWNESGYLGVAPTDLVVTIASNDQSIGTTEQQIVIPAGHNYALATFSSTYKAGSTIITAAATDYTAASQTLITTGYTASKLAVYGTPSSLPADNGAYQSVQVQLQDSQGRPAKSPADLTVNLFSSQPTVATVSQTVMLPMGQTLASGTLKVTKTAGQSMLTAQASSYTTSMATIETSKIDLSPLTVTVTANPSSVYYTNKTEVTAYLSSEGNPVTGAAVQFTSNSNGNFSGASETGLGYYTATFNTPANSSTSSITVTVSASKAGYLNSNGTAPITVAPPPATTNSTAASLATSILVMQIVNVNGDPVSDAEVSSTAQPSGLLQLTGTTNESGYVTFQNVRAGFYAFDISKTGYETLSQSLNFTGVTASFMLTQTPADNSMLIIAPIVAIILIVAIAFTVIKRRRKGSSKALQPLTWPMSH